MGTVRQTFTVRGRLPGLNEYTKACRQSPHAGNEMKRRAQARVAEAIEAYQVEPMEPRVRIDVTWVEKDRRRDMDNVVFAKKFVWDALVEAGVIGDDGWDWIEGFSDRCIVRRDDPRVVVTLTGELRKGNEQ